MDTVTRYVISEAVSAMTESLPASSSDERHRNYVETGHMKKALGILFDEAVRKMPNTKVVGTDGKPIVQYHGGNFGTNGKFIPDVPLHLGTERASFDRMRDSMLGGGVSVRKTEAGRYFWKYRDMDDAGYDRKSKRTFKTRDDALRDFYTNHIGNRMTACFINVTNPLEATDQESDWDCLVSDAKKRGYDGIRYVNNWEDRGSVSWAVFSPSQVKSAEITYDDSGSLIPLSKRFDFSNPDMRY